MPVCRRLVTQSSHEGYHLYWLVTDCPLDRFTGLQKALSEKFGGDPAVADIPRVMRLPGFVWRKVGKDGKPEGEPFLSCIVTGYDAGARVPTYTIDEVVSRLQLSDAIAKVPPKAALSDFEKMVALGSNSPLQPEVRGRWPEILSNLNIDASVLDGQHHPCPGCGGEDRFRFDNLDGNGTFLCSGGGGDMAAGDGFALVRHVFECDPLEADRRVRLALDGGAKVIVADALAEYEQTGAVGVLFGERVLDALNDLHDNDLSEWQTIRARLKADKGVSITEIERGMARQRATEVGPPTEDVHDLDYAIETIASFGEGNLLHDGTTFWSWRETGVWSRTDDPSVEKADSRCCTQERYYRRPGELDSRLVQDRGHGRGLADVYHIRGYQLPEWRAGVPGRGMGAGPSRQGPAPDRPDTGAVYAGGYGTSVRSVPRRDFRRG